MTWKFEHIGLIGTHRNPLVAETIDHLCHILETWGLQVLLEQETAAALSEQHNGSGIEYLATHCDLVITVGGDGNLLSAARVLSLHNVPVVGVNRGKLGFLTDIKPHDIDTQLKALLQGKYHEAKRFLIEGVVERDGKKMGSGNALNDIVLYPGEVAHLIEFEVRVNKQFVYSQRSDGIIIATPTGSTAYALSAGGPIIEPTMNTLVLVPKLPHTLSNRPLLIDAASEITLVVGRYEKCDPQLTFDGQNNIELKTGDLIHIRQQTQPLRLLHPEEYNYFRVLRDKLNWGRQLIDIGTEP